MEINCFANPFPYRPRLIQTYIGEYLLRSSNESLIREFELEAFEVNVLSLERTYFEKVLSLNRLSYDGIKVMEEKVRHFYDIHELHGHSDLKGRVLTAPSYEIIVNVRKDDETNRTMAGEWQGQLITSSPLFANLEEVWSKLTGKYYSALEELVWESEIPSSDSVLSVMRELREFMKNFDRAHPPTIGTSPRKRQQP